MEVEIFKHPDGVIRFIGIKALGVLVNEMFIRLDGAKVIPLFPAGLGRGKQGFWLLLACRYDERQNGKNYS
jgi:hypothetical protein